MDWQTQLKGDALPWLLETSTPEVRYLALRDLLDLPELTARVGAARFAEVLLAARDADRDACLLLLEHPGRRAGARDCGRSAEE